MWLMVLWFFCVHAHAFKLGIENISEDLFSRLAGKSIGLVTNQTGRDGSGKRTLDILQEKGLSVRAVYVPEHGYDGVIKAGRIVTDGSVSANVPIISLYGHGVGKIEKGHFDLVDVIMVDLQDVGMRHYTYISTLYTIMEASIPLKKEIIVLDRPNLLGAIMEGPLCLSSLRSFIGIAEIPLRHGMTIGELAHLFNKNFSQRVKLTVVPMSDYRRSMLQPALLAHLSPNITHINSVYGYSFLGLLGEVSPFYTGVGTSNAFCYIMLPRSLQVNLKGWQKLEEKLLKCGIVSRFFDEPIGNKKGYEGLKLEFGDMNTISSFKAFMEVLTWTKEQGIAVTFKSVFDRSIGTPAVRNWYESNVAQDDFLQATKKDLQHFFDAHKDILLYQEDPKIVYKRLFGSLA